jgi:hypothetical protein
MTAQNKLGEKRMKKKKGSRKSASALAERRNKNDRRKKTAVDLIYQRLVARKILPDRRKTDRRKI